MALTPEETGVLKKQGLAADIRNQLSNAKGLSSTIEAWEKETNLETKAKLLEIIKSMSAGLTKNVDHICDALELYADPKNKIPFSHF